jgi:DNA-binding MarR family transcriptional regulator
MTPQKTQGKKANGDRRHQNGELFAFLRYSHIFASLVREILEEKILAEVSPAPLSLSQFHLLKLIAVNGEHQVGEAADFLGVSPPACTKNIDKLEGLGLVSRSPSPGDRRATLLTSSSKGRKLVEEYEALKEERLAPVLAGFRAGELGQLAGLLERFSLRLLKAEDTGDGLCFRCSAYYTESCPVDHVHGGCPYQRIRTPRSKDGLKMDAQASENEAS